MNNNPPNPPPSVTEEMIEAGARAIAQAEFDFTDGNVMPKWSEWRDHARECYLAMKSAAPLHTGLDKWNPGNEDPFWMLEAEDGEWLKNERTLSGTRDPAKALRFPTEREAAKHPALMAAGSKWWSAKPTEHTWIQPPPNTDLTDVEQEARFLCERLRDLEGNIFDDEVGTEYYGHVAPSRARLEMLLADRAALLVSNRSGVESEIERLQDLLDTERYKVAIGVQAVLKAIQSRQWLSEPGRGSYAYDDERYQQEFGQALNEIEAALSPLRAIARDWSDCPTDPLRVAANRSAARTALDTENSEDHMSREG